jgi:hypothetical protein
MTNIVNLKRVRKAKARSEKEAAAEANGPSMAWQSPCGILPRRAMRKTSTTSMRTN